MEVIDTPLIVLSGHPQSISIEKLSNLTQGKHIVFYTGAGISASVVPTMPAIMRELGITKDLKREANALDFIKKF